MGVRSLDQVADVFSDPKSSGVAINRWFWYILDLLNQKSFSPYIEDDKGVNATFNVLILQHHRERQTRQASFSKTATLDATEQSIFSLCLNADSAVWSSTVHQPQTVHLALCWQPLAENCALLDSPRLEGDKKKAASEGRSQHQAGGVATNPVRVSS